MNNTNRDFLVVCDVKNSTLIINRPIKFYITDKNTSNIFIRLVTQIEYDDNIKKYVDIEPANSYAVTMRIIKPNNEVKSVIASQLEEGAIYQVDLQDDCKDIPGMYKCELLMSTLVYDRQELNTSDAFTYRVERSILSNISEIVETVDTTVEDVLNQVYIARLEMLNRTNAVDLQVKNIGRSTVNQGEIEIIGHRGLGGLYPEGTCLAFKNSILRGEADSVEFDIRWTSDGKYVVMHDTTVDRTTNGEGNVKDMTGAELKALDHGSYKSSVFAGTNIPYLEEALSVCRGLPLKHIYPQVNVSELGDVDLARQQLIEVIDIFKRYELLDKIILQCVGVGSITTFQIASMIREINEDITIMLMVDSNETSIKNNVDWCVKQQGRFMLGCSKDIFLTNPTIANYAKDNGVDIVVWTVNSLEELQTLRKSNICRVMTDTNLKGVF